MGELVTNSLKHAFPDAKGTITVILEREADGTIALLVSDDGRGRPPENAAPGSRQQGLGTTIINGLVNQLHGEQILGNEHLSGNQHGARTEIRVPAPVLS